MEQVEESHVLWSLFPMGH